MTETNEQVADRLFGGIVEIARAILPEAIFQVIEPFLRHYYELADLDDLRHVDPDDLYGAAMAHWQSAQKFKTGAEVLRVYNPEPDRDGWRSDHTVVEIVSDDMPFLVDSVTASINGLGLALHVAIHPVFRVWRDTLDAIVRVDTGRAHSDEKPSSLESFIHFEIDRCESSRLENLRGSITRVLGDVRAVVEDWPEIAGLAHESISELQARDRSPDGIEARAFLAWMIAGNFTFLGYRDYDLVTREGALALRGEPGSGAGILRETLRPSGGDDVSPLPPAATAIVKNTAPIFLTKSNERSTVHRPGYLDHVSVKRLAPDGGIIGERRFIGLYTSTAYMAPTYKIPIVRRKCANIVRRAGAWASEERLREVLEQYPRDELFQADEDFLIELTLNVLRLERYPQTRIFARFDPFNRFIWCLVFVPRDKWTTELRHRISRWLVAAFNAGSIEFTPLLSESELARIYFVMRFDGGTMSDGKMRRRMRMVERIIRYAVSGGTLKYGARGSSLAAHPEASRPVSGAGISVLSGPISQDELRALLVKHDSPYADYVCTTGLTVALNTDPCSTLNDFVDRIASIPATKIELAWPGEITEPNILPGVGVLGIFGSGAIRSIGKVTHFSTRGVGVEISDGLELLDPDADMAETAYKDSIDSQVILVGVEVG